MKILDTTLRDGMQTPGIGCNLEKRLKIAEAIAKCNVDVMEIGMPANKIDRKFIPIIANQIYNVNPNVEICVLARGNKIDVEATREVYEQIKNPKRVHLYVPTSTELRESSIKRSEKEVLEMVKHFVDEFEDYKLEFSPEDAARTDPNFLVKVLEAAQDAYIFNLPDTTGWCSTKKYGEMFHLMARIFKNPLSVHCHNDNGMAVANSITAIENGATQVEGCVLGIGERAGNVDWMQVVANLHMNNYPHNLDMKQFVNCAETVADVIGVNIPPNYPIVGENFARTSSGGHANAIMKDPSSYYALNPELFGHITELVLGQTSGSKILEAKLQEYGIPYNGNFPELMEKVLKHCMENGTITKKEMLTLI